MKTSQSETKSGALWQKTQYTNLWRYLPSGILYARVRVKGKLRVKSLKTPSINVGKLRLSDFEKTTRGECAHETAVMGGKMSMKDALDHYQKRVIHGDPDLKPKSKSYYDQVLVALRKSWPQLDSIPAAKLRESDVMKWAARVSPTMSASVYNHTVGFFKGVMRLVIKSGARYDNPCTELVRKTVKPKKLVLQRGSIQRVPASLGEWRRAVFAKRSNPRMLSGLRRFPKKRSCERQVGGRERETRFYRCSW